MLLRVPGAKSSLGLPTFAGEAVHPERVAFLYRTHSLWPEKSAAYAPPSPGISGLVPSGGLGWLGRQSGQLDPECPHDLQNGVVPWFGTRG